MSQNLKTALEESGRVLDLIGQKTLPPEEQKRVIAESVQYWTDYVNPGFLEYRKSVSTDYTTVTIVPNALVHAPVNARAASARAMRIPSLRHRRSKGGFCNRLLTSLTAASDDNQTAAHSPPMLRGR